MPPRRCTASTCYEEGMGARKKRPRFIDWRGEDGAKLCLAEELLAEPIFGQEDDPFYTCKWTLVASAGLDS
jgi:hypothetical protein